MRPLTLHVSALSDSEYDLYTASLDDLATDTNTNFAHNAHVRDDAHYEQTFVGAREVRAWLRGRYSNLPTSDIDSILKLFSPHMLPSDTLSGGQFFAALRLAIHAGSGKGVDRTLAFVQASLATKSPDVPRPRSPSKRSVHVPPSHPDRQKPSFSSLEMNPFMRKSTEPTTVSMPQPDVEPAPMISQHRPGKIGQNPFLARAHNADKTTLPANPSNQGKLPPLPPRKPSLLASPPRRPSEAAPTMIYSTTNSMTPSGPPLIPLKPAHVMSPLMKQSLEASKHAQSLKRAEEQLDQERVLQVLKTTSSSSSSTQSTRTRSLSPSKQHPKLSNGCVSGSVSAESDDATRVPPLPRRRKPSLPSSTSSSALSLEQVASASLPSPFASAPSRPPLPSRDPLTLGTSGATSSDLPAVAGPGPTRPPTHPYRRPSTASAELTVNDSPSSTPRVARSRSVTAASTSSSSSSTYPPPPPRRKRPESMQLTTPTTSDGGALPSLPYLPARTHGRTSSLQGVSRHLSLTRGSERARLGEPSEHAASSSSSSPMANIHKTLAHLQLKAQPKLDAVRYKAEAGISKRGYIHHHPHLGGSWWREEGEQVLMADTRWTAADVDRDPDSEPTTDGEGEGHDPRKATRTAMMTESDNLKWPMGEGWKPL